MSTSPAPRDPNRRRTRRFSSRGHSKVSCQLGRLGLGKNVALGVVNISETGACLLLKTSVAEGQEAQLAFEGIQHRRSVTIPARVSWAVQADEGTFKVGFVFERQLSWGDLQALARM